MFNLSDTICAICTPVGTGSIAAIRISGPDSWEIVRRIFCTVIARRCKAPTKQSHNATRNKIASSAHSVPPRNDTFEHMHAVHGFIKDNEKTIDEVVLLPYKAPKSYTAEDVVEIFCHGGNQIASMILDLCLKNGARQAKAGEFTFRAFVNGRIDLTEAEAINEIIHAETQKSVFAATSILAGSLKEKLNNFRERIFDLITTIESAIEFPLDVEEIKKNEIASVLTNINLELIQLIESSKEGQILRDGIKVSIIGAANVGKSSLLNQLLESQRSIVTDEAGTTRDTIEEKLIVDGYPVVLIDTAGIRKNKKLNEPELIGIERSKNALEKSDLALLVIDLSQKEDADTKEIFELLNGKPKIIVGNKLDLLERAGENCDISISAKYGINIDELKQLIKEKIKSFTQTSILSFQPFYINQRQKELLLQSSSHINFALESVRKNQPEDLIADELKKSISKLDEVSGRKINDNIIKNIFAKFCIGK